MLFVFVGAVLAQEGGPPPVILQEEPERPARESAFDHGAEGWGLGILLGIPTGLSAAYRPGGRAWYDMALAWSFDRGTLDLHGDVLLTLAELRTDEIPDFTFPVWLGVGPRVRLGDSRTTWDEEILGLGVRVPVGMSLVHEGVPLEAFLELAPGIGLYPATVPFFDVAIGGRYYFGRGAPAAPAAPAGTSP